MLNKINKIKLQSFISPFPLLDHYFTKFVKSQARKFCLCRFIVCQSKAPNNHKTTSLCCSRSPTLVKSRSNQIWKAALGKHRRHSRQYIFCLFAASLRLFAPRVSEFPTVVDFSVSEMKVNPLGDVFSTSSLNFVFVLPKPIIPPGCSRNLFPAPVVRNFNVSSSSYNKRQNVSVWIPIIPSSERSRQDFKCLRMTVNNKERDTCTQDIC